MADERNESASGAVIRVNNSNKKTRKTTEPRSPNWEPGEVTTLLDFVQEHYRELFGETGKHGVKEIARKAWEMCAEEIRMNGGNVRKAKSVQKKWQDEASLARKYQTNRIASNQTGGGPQVKFNEKYERILDILPNESVHGITPVGSTESVPQMQSFSTTTERRPLMNFDMPITGAPPPPQTVIVTTLPRSRAPTSATLATMPSSLAPAAVTVTRKLRSRAKLIKSFGSSAIPSPSHDSASHEFPVAVEQVSQEVEEQEQEDALMQSSQESSQDEEAVQKRKKRKKDKKERNRQLFDMNELMLRTDERRMAIEEERLKIEKERLEVEKKFFDLASKALERPFSEPTLESLFHQLQPEA